jgi:hypothetical protein
MRVRSNSSSGTPIAMVGLEVFGLVNELSDSDLTLAMGAQRRSDQRRSVGSVCRHGAQLSYFWQSCTSLSKTHEELSCRCSSAARWTN